MLDIQDPVEARKVIRENKYTEQTAGSANKYVQGNLCILPSKYAMDFASFCQKNPKPCPLIGFGTKGDPSLKDLGDIDIVCTDLGGSYSADKEPAMEETLAAGADTNHFKIIFNQTFN